MKTDWNVFVTARAFFDSGLDAKASLEAIGCKIEFAEKWGPVPASSLLDQMKHSDAVIAATDAYTNDVFDACQSLKLVARCGVGIDSVSLDDATNAGVIVTNVPDAMTDAVADYCLGLILASVRRICDGSECMKTGGWTEFRGFELAGKVLGLVGFGKIGQAVMRRAIGFGMSVIAHDPFYAESIRRNQFPGVEFVELDEVFSRSRIVSIHAPNQPETVHLVSVRPEIEMIRNLLNKMQKSSPKIEPASGFARCIC